MSFWDISINLVNKDNLVHSLFSVYLSICTWFVYLCAHRQEKQLCLCDTGYLLFSVYDCLVPDSISSTQCHINTIVSPDDGHIFAQNM